MIQKKNSKVPPPCVVDGLELLENGSPPKILNPPLLSDVDGSRELIPPKILSNEDPSGGGLVGELAVSPAGVEKMKPLGWVGI